jgi:hypothetical protein
LRGKLKDECADHKQAKHGGLHGRVVGLIRGIEVTQRRGEFRLEMTLTAAPC